MKLDPANPIELRFWCDTFLAHISDGPVAAGRHADLAVETMRERMPEQEPGPTVRDVPGWVAHASDREIARLIRESIQRGGCSINVNVDGAPIIFWSPTCESQAEALVDALISIGFKP